MVDKLLVYFATMANLDYLDLLLLVVKPTDNPVVSLSDAVEILLGEFL